MEFPNRFTVSLAAAASFPFFLLGFEVSVIIGQTMIQNSFREDIEEFEDFIGCLVSLMVLVASISINYFGRKWLLVFGAATYVLGATISCSAQNFAAYKVGRGFMGTGMGVGILVGPIYIAESSPASFRGLLGSLPQVFLCIGQILGYVIQFGMSKSNTKHAWRIMMGFPLVLSAVVATFISFRLYESPCYMVIEGKLTKAKTLLADRLGCPEEEVNERIAQLKVAANIPPHITQTTTHIDRSQYGGIARMWSQLIHESYDAVFFIAALHIMDVMSGEYTIQTYLKEVLSLDHYISKRSYLVARLILVSTRTFFSLLMVFLVDCCGRKRLLLTSILTTVVATVIWGAASVANQQGHISNATVFKYYIAGGLLLEAGVGIGIGGLPWLYGPEAFKLPSRAVGVGIPTTFALILGWIMDARKMSAYDSRSSANRMMFLSAALLIVCAPWCSKVMTKGIRSKQVLIDAEIVTSSDQQPQTH
ncbi:Probable polyol transporter 6 [Linum perenne]